MDDKKTIVIATTRPDELQPFAETLSREYGLIVTNVGSAEEAADRVGRNPPALMVVDQTVGEFSALEIVRRLLAVNAFVHVAVMSDRDEDAFHEESEGLGILIRLPIDPAPVDGRELMNRLRQVTNDQTY